MTTDRPTTRREFLATTARVLCAAVLAAGAALLSLRGGRAACQRSTACDRCRHRSGCGFATDPELPAR